MIRVVLKGALGNQLFQYAHGKSLALKHGVPLVLDLSFLKTRIPLKNLTFLKDFTYRNYTLDLFEIDDATESFFKNNFLDKYFSYVALSIKNLAFQKHYIKEGENPYTFHNNISAMGNDLTLEGFWNNYNYFNDYEIQIKEIFDLDKLYNPEFSEYENRLKSTNNSVSLHIRRGDYLNKKHIEVYVILDDYYVKAVNLIKKRVKNPHFYIFSETDTSWLETKLSLKKDEYTVVGNDLSGIRDSSHFRFMGLCKHNIIANSSYSWWAAYLNNNHEKIVVAPKRWHHKYDFENIPSWIEIEN